MTLPEGFQFSQSSLQDFIDCRRKFQLRFLRQLAWPAIQSEPALEFESYLRQGALFHRMVQQHQLGVPLERLAQLINDDDLSRWWVNYTRFVNTQGGLGSLTSEDARCYPEIVLSASVGSFRMVAKYDLVVIAPDGSVVIFDWKTSRKRPRRRWLAERLQTRVYPYVMVRGGSHLNHEVDIQPDRVEFVYWFADHPEEPERFSYTQEKFQEDHNEISELIESILGLDEQGFSLTQDHRRCLFCVYRSLCGRGEKAGMLDDWEVEIEAGGDFQLGLDYEQIQEIEF